MNGIKFILVAGAIAAIVIGFLSSRQQSVEAFIQAHTSAPPSEPIPRPSSKQIKQPFENAAKQQVALKAGAMKIDPADRNLHNRKLMAMSEEDRRTMFIFLFATGKEQCEAITRTFYQGSVKPSWNAIWNVECRGGLSYVVKVMSDEKGSTSAMTCGELRAMGGGECFVKLK